MFENGSEQLRVDFHLHTRKDKEFKYNGEENSFVKDYIDAMERQNISIGIITNHNKFDMGEYKALRTAARKRGILILPGVELSVKEGANGLHVLIVFNPDEWLSEGNDDINKFLDGVFAGIANRENANTRCRCDLPVTIDSLNNYGKDYFIVFAHVDQKNGLFEECNGGILASLAAETKLYSRVLGLQKVRNISRFEKLPDKWNTHIARVEGSDPKRIDDIGKDGSACFIKMGDLSYAALRYALADSDSRVLSDNPIPKHGYIRSIHFDGGRINQQDIGLSSQLNTLIGIRGSGKSSIIEAIRYALNITPTQDASYKDELIKYVLRDGGKITLIVIDENGKEYRIERINGERPVIFDANGASVPITPSVLLKNPLYFGQKDLSMSKPGYELELLNKLVGANIPSNEREMQTTISQLESSIRQLLELQHIPDQIKELEDKDKEYEHKLKVFGEKGITERLAKQTAYVKDIAKLNSLIKAVSQVISDYQSFAEKYDTSGISLSGYISDYNADIIARAQELIISINNHIAEMTKHSIGIEEDRESITELLTQLKEKADALREEFAKIKREIADDSIDIEGFEKYQAEKAAGLESIAQLKRKVESQDSILQALATDFHKRNELLRATFAAYQKEIERINGSQSELVITIEFKGDKPKFIELLRTSFRGSRLTDAKYQKIAATFTDFAAIIEDYFLNDGQKLKECMNEREYVSICEKIASGYSELIKYETPNLVQISYHGKELNKHSMGQRASALILFILSQDDNDVIIIDQPEDDLDNQVVYTEFIRTLRDKKVTAQFMFATHNANIPVLGDAEKVVAASYDNNVIELTMGSIDTPVIHERIIEIMEGGYEAFQRRNSIYKAWH